jgi:uncharacterized protein Yka (UPF0111/DUF47 family)
MKKKQLTSRYRKPQQQFDKMISLLLLQQEKNEKILEKIFDQVKQLDIKVKSLEYQIDKLTRNKKYSSITISHL